MLDPQEVIQYYKELKEQVSKISDPMKKQSVVKQGLDKYSLNEWCEVGDILRNAKLM